MDHGKGDYFLQRIEVFETLMEDDKRYCAMTGAGMFGVAAEGPTIEAACRNLIEKVNSTKPRRGAERYMPQSAVRVGLT